MPWMRNYYYWKMWSCLARKDMENMPKLGDFKRVDTDLNTILDQLIITVGESQWQKNQETQVNQYNGGANQTDGRANEF